MRHAYPVVVVAVFLVLVLAGILTQFPQFTGRAIVAQGGTVTEVNITVGRGAPSWAGVYGNVSDGPGSSGVALAGDQVFAVNLSYDSLSNQTLVVASTVESPEWSVLAPASLSEVNSFVGLPAPDSLSGSSTFTGLENFSIDGMTYETWSATTMSTNGSFVTGALSANGSLLFVTRAFPGMYGFLDEPTDYQLLLPVPSGGVNYSFFVFEEGDTPAGSFVCNGSFNFSAVLAPDNSSVLLSWDALPGADSYELKFLDGPSGGFLDWDAASTIVVGAPLFYIDVAPAERYYRLNVISGSQECLSNVTAGTLSLSLSPDYNLISTPFTLENASVKESLRSIDGSYSSVNEFDNAGKLYRYYTLVGGNLFKNFDDLSPGRVYWVNVPSPVDVRLVGEVVESLNVSVTPDYNLVSFPVISNSAQNESVAFVLTSIDGTYDSVNEFDNAAKIYKYYTIVGSSLFKNFDSVRPGYGYWVKVAVPGTVEYANG